MYYKDRNAPWEYIGLRIYAGLIETIFLLFTWTTSLILCAYISFASLQKVSLHFLSLLLPNNFVLLWLWLAAVKTSAPFQMTSQLGYYHRFCISQLNFLREYLFGSDLSTREGPTAVCGRGRDRGQRQGNARWSCGPPWHVTRKSVRRTDSKVYTRISFPSTLYIISNIKCAYLQVWKSSLRKYWCSLRGF